MTGKPLPVRVIFSEKTFAIAFRTIRACTSDILDISGKGAFNVYFSNKLFSQKKDKWVPIWVFPVEVIYTCVETLPQKKVI